jgi:CheY-like chemotaxis protein
LAYSAPRSALILIVDDDPVLTRMTARVLEPLGGLIEQHSELACD